MIKEENLNEIPLTFNDNIIEAQIMPKKSLNYFLLILSILSIICFILIFVTSNFLMFFVSLNLFIYIALIIYFLFFASITGIFNFNLEKNVIEYFTEFYFTKVQSNTFNIENVEKFELITNSDCYLSYNLNIVNFDGTKINVFKGYASKFENGYDNPNIKTIEQKLNEKLQKNSYRNY
jgi:hypothetical protein